MLLIHLLIIYFISSVSSFIFNPKQSSSYQTFNKTFQVPYLDGTLVRGILCEDFVKIGAFTFLSKIGCITMSSQQYSTDGILGLGFPTGNDIIFSETIPNYHKIFTIVINKYTGGLLQVGGIDLLKIPNIDYRRETKVELVKDCLIRIDGNVTSKECMYQSFRITIGSIRLGNKFLYSEESFIMNSLQYPNGLTAIIDSGTTCLILPSKIGSDRLYLNLYSTFMEEINSIMKLSPNNLPSLYISINNNEFEIPFQSLILDSISVNINFFNLSEFNLEK